MNRKPVLISLLIIALLGVLTAAAADRASEAVVSPALTRMLSLMPGGETLKVWVFFKPGSGPLYDSGKRDELLAGGGRLHYLSRWLNAASLETDADDINRLRSLEFVRRLQPVRIFRRPISPPRQLTRPLDTPPDTSGLFERYGSSAGQLLQINVPGLHDRGLSGEGIRIAILDTGFYKEHEALVPCSVYSEWDFVDGDDNTQDDTEQTSGETPFDSHGTSVWSILGGNMPGKLVGPAYNAEFLLARTEVEDYERRSEEDWYVAALEWADSLGASIVSSSLGYTTFDDGFGYDYTDLNGDVAVTTVAADIAASRGILVVTAMGNDGLYGTGSINTPADGDSVVAVGAVDYYGVRADFSSIGPTFDGRKKPEVAALGKNVYAAFAGNPTGYHRPDGTSTSTPLVAGLAALLWEGHPEWGPMQVREALIATASQRDHPDNELGWGIPDGLAALEYFPGGIQLTLFTAENFGDRIEVNWGVLDWSRVESLRLLRKKESNGGFTDITPEGLVPGDRTSYVDSLVQPNQVYNYKLEMEDTYQMLHEFGPIFATVLPLEFNLTQNYPNPFNVATTIEFRMPSGWEGRVKLTVYNILGREVRNLVDENRSPGYHKVEFDGRDDDDRTLPSGVYFYRLWVKGKSSGTHKMVLTR